ncbi:MAG: PQQ-binding-like beta-propeller repeat protein [Planctomycetota bacterium]
MSIFVNGEIQALGQEQSSDEPIEGSVENESDSLWTREGEDWPDFLGAGRTGVCNETGLVNSWIENGLKVRWTFNAGEGYSIGSVSHGRMIHFDRMGDSCRVVCLNAESGETIWTYQYPCDYADMYGFDGGPRCSPVIDEDRVYVYGPAGRLICLRIAGDEGVAAGEPGGPGSVVWERDVSGDYSVVQNFFGVGSAPLVHGDLLLVMVGGSPPADSRIPQGQLDRVGPDGSLVVAMNKLTGEEVYRTVDDLASYSSIAIADIDGETTALVLGRERLSGINPRDGEELFEFAWRSRILESVNAANPVITGNRILITECYGPGSAFLEVSDGEVETVWSDAGKRNKAMQAHWNTPVLRDGFVYGCSGRHSNDAQLRCVDIETGAVKWFRSGLSRSSLTWIEDHFVVLGEYGKLRLITAQPDRYEEVARYDSREAEIDLEYPCWAAPVISHGLMFIRDKKRVVCFEFDR